MDFFFILFAKYLFVIAFLIAGIFFLKQPREIQIKAFILGVSCATLSYIIALIAGQIYYDPRPFVVGHFKPLIDHDTENGFPSDHVLLVSCVAAVITVFNNKIAIPLWIVTILVAISRVYVGVHHYIDVFASIMITVVVTFVLRYGLNGRLMNLAVQKINNLLLKVNLKP
jgi:undecaprenyl-diphosphatase